MPMSPIHRVKRPLLYPDQLEELRRYRRRKAIARITKLLAIVITLLMVAVVVAHEARAVDCRASKGAGHPWSWRQIDGKRCWYKGKAGIAKAKLHWPKAAATTVGAGPARKTAPSNIDELLHTVWPPSDSFNQRFKGQ